MNQHAHSGGLPHLQRAALVALALFSLLAAGCAPGAGSGHPGVTGLRQENADTLVANQNLTRAIRALNDDGTINVVVEVPAGTNEKWEVNEAGVMVREFTGNAPRTIRYLPYPGNYGMVPRTFLDPKHGGDNAPLDAIVIGSAVPRGHVIRAYPIGMLRMLDHGEQDDKILAVRADSHFKNALDIDELEKQFPGSTLILKTWFSNYSGGNDQIVLGFGSRASALKMIQVASEDFEARQ